MSEPLDLDAKLAQLLRRHAHQVRVAARDPRNKYGTDTALKAEALDQAAERIDDLVAEVERLRARTYYDGCRDTLYRFAVHRDGGMVVGCGMTTYKDALAAIDAAEAADRSYSLYDTGF